MGRVEKETAKGIRIWAPAQLVMPNPANVFYVPIAFCEQYYEMFWSGARGTNEVPTIIAQGYEGFFKNFREGGYNMAPWPSTSASMAKLTASIRGLLSRYRPTTRRRRPWKFVLGAILKSAIGKRTTQCLSLPMVFRLGGFVK